jgi:starch synthase
MKILTISAEVAPFAKAGGLGDVAASLPKAFEQLEHENLVVLPKYGNIDVHKYSIKPTDVIVAVPMGTWTEYARLWTGILPDSHVTVYLLENADYFDREGIYGNPDGFTDNDRRFIFLTRAAFETARTLGFRPDIVHAHDNHTALAMPMLKISYAHDSFFNKAAGILTIHNMAYQGLYEAQKTMQYMGLHKRHFFKGSWFEQYGAVNSLKAGIMFADKVTTVSPTYAHEIRWTHSGEGLQDALHARAADVIGVLNGVDYTEWNPEIDTLIYKNYTHNALPEKEHNKHRLLLDFGLSTEEILDGLPLIGMVSRLTPQKGIDLLEKSLEHFVKNKIARVVLLGSGENRYEDFFRYLGKKYPRRALVQIGYNNSLSHKITAASDFFLVPSRFEPCGLTQMYALKYGTIPIVRATGGLADTVVEYDGRTGYGTGFVFHQYSSQDFRNAINRALSHYRVKPHWDIIRHNAMSQNYSSLISAQNYINVFNWALEKVR